MYAIHGSRQSQNYEQVQMLDAYLAYSIQVQKIGLVVVCYMPR